eukprot:IDg14683t1
MSQTLPTDELHRRTSNSRKLHMKRATGDESGDVSEHRYSDRAPSEFGDDDNVNDHRKRTREIAIQRLNDRKKPGASIMVHAQELKAAKEATPESNYPGWLLKFIPRLKRVASPAEKLFWFGSHKFYMWCVEWVLFFTTINLSAVLAKVGFALKEKALEYEAQKGKKAARMLMLSPVMRAKTKHSNVPTDNFMLLIVALFVAIFALIFVLFRVASIMKKYIFVLNNANMLPEIMTIESIQAIRTKDMMHGAKYEAAHSDGSDTELDDGEFAQTRRNMSNFFTNEVKGGRMPGTEGGQNKRRISISSRRTSSQGAAHGADGVEAVASASMDGTPATAEVMWSEKRASEV